MKCSHPFIRRFLCRFFKSKALNNPNKDMRRTIHFGILAAITNSESIRYYNYPLTSIQYNSLPIHYIVIFLLVNGKNVAYKMDLGRFKESSFFSLSGRF